MSYTLSITHKSGVFLSFLVKVTSSINSEAKNDSGYGIELPVLVSRPGAIDVPNRSCPLFSCLNFCKR